MRNNKNTVKLFLILTVMFDLFLLVSFYSFAEAPTPVEMPTFEKLFNLILKIFGIILAVSGGVFVIMVAYGIIKSSLATGDPRGIEGAKSTWSYAIYGFMVIIISWVLVIFIRNLLGMSTEGLSPSGFLNSVLDGINSLVDVSKTSGRP